VIKFGTSGWRAIIADEFTFANVQLVTRAICNYLKDKGTGQLIVGYDPRFMAERFSEQAAQIIAANGFEALLCTRDTPTPAISYAIRNNKALGGINFTASHNPPEYCGIKFSTADGAPALPDVTKAIEAEIQSLQKSGSGAKPSGNGAVKEFDARPGYLADLESKLKLDLIARAGLRIGYDALWATGRGYLDEILTRHGCEVKVLHDWRDPYFGGHAPEPGEEHLEELKRVVLDGGYDLGVSTDGDSDRFGVLDRDGTFITPNQLISLLVGYLAESRKWPGGVARSVATSHLVDRAAGKLGIKVYETPVGFKFIGELINEDAIIIGGEESAGLTIKGHYPEKDGILACLLAAEMVAARQASLGEMLSQLYSEVGEVHNARIGVHLTDEIKKRLQDRLAGDDPKDINGRRVASVNRIDGVKYIFDDGSWLLVRLSGTEPLARCYAETDSAADLEVLLETGKKFILG